MVPGSKLIDAPPHNLSFKDIEEDVTSHELIVIHTSTPKLQVGLQDRDDDPRHQSHRQDRLHRAPRSRSNRSRAWKLCSALDFVARNEYDFTIKELAEGAAWSTDHRPDVSQTRRGKSSRTRATKSWSTWTSCRRCCRFISS